MSSNPCLSAIIQSMSYVSPPGDSGQRFHSLRISPSDSSRFPTHLPEPASNLRPWRPKRAEFQKLVKRVRRTAGRPVRLELRNLGQRHRWLFSPGLLCGNSSSPNAPPRIARRVWGAEFLEYFQSEAGQSHCAKPSATVTERLAGTEIFGSFQR
jgi:hypothetical protein